METVTIFIVERHEDEAVDALRQRRNHSSFDRLLGVALADKRLPISTLDYATALS